MSQTRGDSDDRRDQHPDRSPGPPSRTARRGRRPTPGPSDRSACRWLRPADQATPDHRSFAGSPARRPTPDVTASPEAAGASRTMAYVATRVSSPLFIGRQAELQTLKDAVARPTDEAAIVMLWGRGGHRQDPARRPKSPNGRDASGALVLEGGCVSWATAAAFRSRRSSRRCGGCRRALAGEPLRRLDLDALRTPATAELGRLMPEFGTPRCRRQAGFAAAGMDPGQDLRGRARPPPRPRRASDGGPDPRGPPLGGRLDPGISWRSWRETSEPSALSSSGPTGPTSSTAAIHLGRGSPRWTACRASDGSSCRGSGVASSRHRSRRSLDACPTRRPYRAVERRTEGNPFFVEELLARGAERRAMDCRRRFATSC